MNGDFFIETKITTCLLFKFARGIGHVQSTAAIADRQTIGKDVLAEFNCHFRVERLHKAVTKGISCNNVRMSRAEDQIAVRVNPGPVERHETALVAKRVEIVGEPVVKIL